MDISNLENLIGKIKVHKNGNSLALKKPLLLLLIISKIQNGEIKDNNIHFTDVEKKLSELIGLFGGRSMPRGTKPEQPFFHLGSSEIWNIKDPNGVIIKSFSKTINISILKDPATYGYFDNNAFILLKSEEVRSRITDFILNNWWPETVHDDIRMYLGLARYNQITNLTRSKDFVEKVLSNYRYKCAFCGFDAVFNKLTFGLDAAHIKWFSQNGPDDQNNGLALCKLHHWAFDRGVLTLKPSLQISVSETFTAKDKFSIAFIEELNGKTVLPYKNVESSEKYLHWHNDNVFLG